MKIACVLLVVGIFCLGVLSASAAEPIQIIAPVNHTFLLQADKLKPILENPNIKDRNVVVVSIAGAFRLGKSFMLNFFLKYLYAQYKAHDVSDWIGEKSSAKELDGFKWRSGRKRETVGIWMWSEVFTHDFKNGEKVAIILLDTQGIFDDQTSVKECTTIFALSTMLSSVQCFNLMQNIKEDDLHHLELFTEYGRLALEQSKEIPFQKLLFIVRDWPFAYETGYGLQPGQKVIDETLAGNDDQTPEMRQLRTRLKSSFADISAFLMPHPGMIVAQGNQFTGDVKQIDEDFRKHVKELVPALFAPEKLIAKKIGGQKVRARDLLQYLQTYTKVFNGNALPEPKSVLMATAETTNLILSDDCLNFYATSMKTAIDKVQPFFKENDLAANHQKLKTQAVAKFMDTPKLGGADLTAKFKKKIEDGIESKYATFKAENEKQKANIHNENLSNQLFERLKKKVLEEANHPNADTIQPHLNNVFNAEKQAVFNEFNTKKMGDDEISKAFRAKLEQNVNNYQSTMSTTLDTYNQCINHYNNKMQDSLNKAEYLNAAAIVELHQNVKKEALSQLHAKPGDNELKFKLQPKIEKKIDDQRPLFEGLNNTKRQNFLNKANSHSETVRNQIKAAFENKLRADIGKTYRSDNDFINLFMSSKQNSLQEFASKKMGNDEISNGAHQRFRETLERELDGLQSAMKQLNEANKPPPPPQPEVQYPDVKVDPLGKVIRETDRVVKQVTKPVNKIKKKIKKIFG